MKNLNFRTIIIIALTMSLLTIYQLYWLSSYYSETQIRLRDDLQEVLRSSDFEELAHRVEEISKSDFKGRVDVSLGYDHTKDRKTLRARITDKNDNNDVIPPDAGTRTVVSSKNFGNVLKRPEDLIGIGLNMQRGIHSSLDAIQEVDMAYLDSIITVKLDSIGLSNSHRLFYIRDTDQDNHFPQKRPDTLFKTGSADAGIHNSFRLKVSEDSEYVMTVPDFRKVILKKMIPVILFSFGTLALLVVTFIYLIRIMRKQKELEEIKTDFTNNITHELKTPIAVAYAANDALLNYASSDNTPRMNRYLRVCQEQLRLLDRLVEQILSLSMERDKPLLLNRETINLKDMLLSLTEIFKVKYAGKVSFIIDVHKDVYIKTDRMHLSNIVSNLIDNAIKYSERHAYVTIRGYVDSTGAHVIEVTDKGIGLSSEQQKLIFDKFYRVPKGNIHDVKGYGLGLFYVRSMTEKLGGSVSVRSIPGAGSTFKLIFKIKDNG